jgi:amino acid transporter
VISPARPTKLTLLRLTAATYFLVAGGPYGLEELVQAGGFGYAALAIVVTPIVFSLPTALMVGELASALPEEGGYYAWVKRALGPFWGFVEGWLSLAASFFDMAIYPTLFLAYLARLVPALADGPTRVAVGVAMIAGCTAYNLRGARGIGNASIAFAALLLAPFVVFGVAAFTHAPLVAPDAAALAGTSASNAAASAASSAPSAPSAGVGAGLLVAMWNFMGWDGASTFAGEVERPQRTYPRAMALAVVAVVVTYLGPILAASRAGVAPAQWETGAWVTAAANVGGPWLARAVVVGGALCGLGMYNALLLSYSRVPAALAADGLLPAVFGRTNARGVPVVSVLACSVVYAAGLLLSFRRLVELDLLFYGAALVLELVALVVLRVREPSLVRPFRVPGGLPGAILVGLFPTGLFAFALVKELGDGKGHTAALVASAAAFVVGAAVWLARRRAPAA